MRLIDSFYLSSSKQTKGYKIYFLNGPKLQQTKIELEKYHDIIQQIIDTGSNLWT